MNIFEKIPLLESGEEIFNTLIDNNTIKIERIISNNVKDSKWYDQDHDEWVILLEGEASLEFKVYSKKIFKGDYLFIKAHEKHRIINTSEDAIWLAVHINENL